MAWDIGGAIKGVFGFAGKFVEDRDKRMELENKITEVLLEHAQAGRVAEFQDMQSSRLLYAKEMERAPWLIRMLNGLVRPFGGLGALGTVFWVIWAPYAGYPQLTLPELSYDNPIWAIIVSIISFFFVLRHRAQVTGVKDK